MAVDLLPCPYCEERGDALVYDHRPHGVRVTCGCGATGPYTEGIDNAARLWNGSEDVTRCAYCGEQFANDEDLRKISAHIAKCEKHPLFQANQDNARMRTGLTFMSRWLARNDRTVNDWAEAQAQVAKALGQDGGE